jgi:hypothetical protein
MRLFTSNHTIIQVQIKLCITELMAVHATHLLETVHFVATGNEMLLRTILSPLTAGEGRSSTLSAEPAMC